MTALSMHRRVSGPGFTLTELLVVLCVLAALAGISIPLVRGGLAKSRQSACLGKLRGIGVGLEMYLQEHQDTMPVLQAGRSNKSEDVPVLENTLNAYVENPEGFHCPADGKQFAASGSSYLWNTTQNGRHRLKLEFFGFDADSSRIPLVTDKEAWHAKSQGVNILYADCSVSRDVRFVASKP